VEFTKTDRKNANDTQNRDRIFLSNAPSTSPTMSGRVPATQSVRLDAVCFPGTKESRQDRPYQKLLADSRASTSSTLRHTLLCPLTGKPIPPLEKIEEIIARNLTLSNWRWPRSIAIKGIALALQRWAAEVGLEKAARRGEMLFGMPEPFKYADAANAPWIKLESLPQLTPEEFADRLGGIVDGIERARHTADQEHDTSDQRLLSGDGSTSEDGGAGGEPRVEGLCEGDSDAGDGGSPEGGRVIALHPRGDREGKRGLSRQLVCLELREHQEDLKAFQDAYGSIHRRVQEVKDEGQLMKLLNWSGTSAVMGSLELAIHAIEHVVDELKQLLLNIDMGIVPNTDED
jgi:hypothetical protein